MINQLPNQTAVKMIQTALESVDPAKLIHKHVLREGNILHLAGDTIDCRHINHIYLFGIGKAVAPMAVEAEKILSGLPLSGMVIVKYGHQMPLQNLLIFEAGHPVPDDKGLAASEKLLEMARAATADDLIIFLISGGGSALFERLPDEIGLKELAEMNRLLLASGADIEEMNLLRKKISMVKNGGFLKIAQPAAVYGFILSDIIVDPLADIASGPTVPRQLNQQQIENIIEKYHLEKSLPQPIRHYLLTENQPLASVTKIKNTLIGNNRLAIDSLCKTAESAGYRTLVLSDRICGEAREIARFWAAIIAYHAINREDDKPLCLIGGGEPTVTLHGEGKGGRNQELVLAVLIELASLDQPFFFISLGTDGTDGPTDAAGAWIDGQSWQKSKGLGLDAKTHLVRNDAYPFFEQMNQLLKTGPTGTNVMDLMFCLL